MLLPFIQNNLATQSAVLPPTLITSIPNVGVTIGTPFELDISQFFDDPNGFGLTYTALNLPNGLTISSSGLISGTPI